MLESLHHRLLHAIHGIAESDLHRPEGEGKWSIANVIAHLTDAELVTAVRIRTILCEDAPRLVGYSQEAWVDMHDGESVAELLEQLWFHRRANASLIGRLPSESFERIGVHREYGTLTLRELVDRHVAHIEQHLAQIERIKTTHGLAATSTPSIDGLAAASSGRATSPGPGVTITELWRNGVHRALRVEFAPGAAWPGLDHHIPGPEEVYVLSGDLIDGPHHFTPGTFVHYPAASSHTPHSETGCSLFVFYAEG